jgi:hypothetical protein
MTWLKNHLRDKFLAGALAAVPVVVVVWGALLVEPAIARHHRETDAVPVAACHQRLEHLLGRQADLVCNGLGGQVIGIDFVRA